MSKQVKQRLNIETLDQLLDLIYRNSMLKHEKLTLILKDTNLQLNIDSLKVEKGNCTIVFSEKIE